VLLKAGASTEVKSSEGHPPLWMALQHMEVESEEDRDDRMARRLVDSGASVSVVRT